ncbi:MAG TPA: DeoR family transcriptional regulator [Chloroflexota bacterium]|nr:DeoR family transcriptional regulator [Chloroflexota bacterium]HUM68262.1 DeoR family transcriptional regulator [Chloroflexota bacterium]
MTNGKKSTRDLILHSIKSTPQVTIEELALVADVSPVTVRHHLNTLQADGLIEVASVRRKVGRPYYVYSLSEQGQELFPQRYFSLTNRLLDELKTRLPETVVNDIFIGVVKSLINDHKTEFESLTFEERLNYVIELLAEEGFLARWERTDQGYQIIEYSCPYISVGQKHQEVCTFDKELMLTVLDVPIQQHSCMLNGDDCCHFSMVNGTAVMVES